MEGNADADPDQGRWGGGSRGVHLPWSTLGCPFALPQVTAVKAQRPGGETGRGLGGGGASESIFWPRGLDWPAAPTCSAAERGRVTPSGSASPASGEVRASPLPLQRFVARLCLQGRGGGPAARTDRGLRSKSPLNRRQSRSSDGASEQERIRKVKDHCRSDSASQHLGLALSRTGENLRKPDRDLGDTPPAYSTAWKSSHLGTSQLPRHFGGAGADSWLTETSPSERRDKNQV